MVDIIRQKALFLIKQVLYKNQTIDHVFESVLKENSFDKRDKSFLRLLTTTTIRRIRQIDHLILQALSKPLPKRAQTTMDILRLGTSQLLFLKIPPHAAIYTSVELAKSSNQSFYSGLINGVLRTLVQNGENWITKQDEAILNTPKWLWNEWIRQYGKENTYQIALANLTEPSFDITVKDNPEKWAQKLNGLLTETGSIRLKSFSQPQTMPGFKEGQWWVQNAGAALAVHAFHNICGKKVADFCAAPGGKTAQLIMRGANVDAFDISINRMNRVKENLSRLQLNAHLIIGDVNKCPGADVYDAILIDAPCSATGTIRRHPELTLHKTPQDITNLSQIQNTLLHTAYRLLKPNGELVYCTCSLQQQEGEHRISAVTNLFDILPILSPFSTPQGFIRTFPFQDMDGFFIAHLRKKEKKCL